MTEFDELVVSNILKFLEVYNAARIRNVCKTFYNVYYIMYPDNKRLSLCGMKFRLGHIYQGKRLNKVVKMTNDLVFAINNGNGVHFERPIIKEDSVLFSSNVIIMPNNEIRWICRGIKEVKNDTKVRFDYILTLGSDYPMDIYICGLSETLYYELDGVVLYFVDSKTNVRTCHYKVHYAIKYFQSSSAIIDQNVVRRVTNSYFPQEQLFGRGIIIYDSSLLTIRK